MALTLEQRIERLVVRMNELSFWRDRDFVEFSDWQFNGQPIGVGELWPDQAGTVALTHPPVTVPDDWPLDVVVLDLNLGGEGLVCIQYADGLTETWALDPNHQRFPLLQRHFSLSVTAVARLPFGVPNRSARLERSALVWRDPVVERLFRQIDLILHTASVLRTTEVAEPLVRTAERAFASLDWPSGTLTYLSRVQVSEEMLKIWELPPDLHLHPAHLTDSELQSVAAASRWIESQLEPLTRQYPRHGTLRMSGHAHLDLAWLWPMDETRRKAQRTFHTMVGLLERYPEFRFNHSTAQVYAFLEDDDPDLFARIKEKVATGQWEPVGGMWVEPDINMPAGESLTRQLLYGQRYFQHAFGSTHQVAWLPDTFGFAPSLPQLLRGAGIDSFFTIKLNWAETNSFPYDLFWWQGLDGSRVLGQTFDNPTDPEETVPGLSGYNGDPTPFSALSTWQNYRGKYQFPESLFTIGYGDGGGGVTAEMLERLREMEHVPALPSLTFTNIHTFYQRLHAAVQDGDIPTWVGQLYLELHRGTLTTQGRTKFLHRRAERDLVAAEVLSAMNALLGGPEPTSLEALWRVVLRNEFHDILPGSSINLVYQTTNAELASVIEEAADITERELGLIAQHVAEPGDLPALLIVNPDLSDRPLRVCMHTDFPGAQQVENGFVLTGATPMQALGARVMVNVDPPEGLRVSPTQIENNFIRVTLAENGSLSSIYDKHAEREVLAGPGNQLWAYVDKPRMWDAWDIDAEYQQEGQLLPRPHLIEVVETGPHRGAIRFHRHFRDSSITQEMRLWANSPRLDIVTTLDWHDRHWLVKARFPFAIRADHATLETSFGVIKQPTHRNTSWDAARFEIPGHRFADLSETDYGVALINDGKYGHDVIGNEIGLSLLRSPTYPDPLADEGIQTFTYAIYPHQGNWLSAGVLMEAEDLNRPLFARPISAGGETSWQALRLAGPVLGLGALKVREDGDGLVLRLYEPGGASGDAGLTLPEDWELSAEADLLERETGNPDLAFTPFKIHSWLLRRR